MNDIVEKARTTYAGNSFIQKCADEITQLRAELDESRANDRAAMGYLSAIRDALGFDGDYLALVEHCRGVANDAERYRWLRTNALDCQDTNGLEIVRLIPSRTSPNHADIDSAIDAAMQKVSDASK